MGKAHKPVVSAVVKTICAEKDRDQAHARWREVADNLHRNTADEVVHAIKWAVSRRYMPVEKLTAMCDDTNAAPMIAAQ